MVPVEARRAWEMLGGGNRFEDLSYLITMVVVLFMFFKKLFADLSRMVGRNVE